MKMKNLVASALSAMFLVLIGAASAHADSPALLDPPNCGAVVTYSTLYPGATVRTYKWVYRNCGSSSTRVKIVLQRESDIGCLTVPANSFTTRTWESYVSAGIRFGAYDTTVSC